MSIQIIADKMTTPWTRFRTTTFRLALRVRRAEFGDWSAVKELCKQMAEYSHHDYLTEMYCEILQQKDTYCFVVHFGRNIVSNNIRCTLVVLKKVFILKQTMVWHLISTCKFKFISCFKVISTHLGKLDFKLELLDLYLADFEMHNNT